MTIYVLIPSAAHLTAYFRPCGVSAGSGPQTQEEQRGESWGAWFRHPPTTPGVSFNHIVCTAAYTLSASVCSVCVQVNELQAEAESVLRNALSLSMKKEMFFAFGDLW